MKRAATNKIFSCGVFIRGKFQKHKAVDMNAVLAPEAHAFSKKLEVQLRKEGDKKLLERSGLHFPDKETDDVLRFLRQRRRRPSGRSACRWSRRCGTPGGAHRGSP